MTMMTWRACLLAGAIICGGAFDSFAQTPAPPQATLPSANGQAMLVKNTLTALNHASITGNYTVVRDLASVEFRKRHNAADLAQVFAYLRSQKIDLSPVLVRDPQLQQLPILSADNRLQLIGTFPTQPIAIQFNLIFQFGSDGWTIDEIAVSLVDRATAAQAVEQPVAAATPSRVQPAAFHEPVQHPDSFQPALRRLPRLER